MKTETFLRQTLEEWSAEAQVPSGLADRALRRRARRRFTSAALVVGSAALLAGAGVAIDARIGKPPSVVRPVDTSLHTDPSSAPPKRFVAAGQVAISAYYTSDATQNGRGSRTRTWYLYNPASGGYRKVPWAWVDVAPGLRQAAVLDGPLPSARVGIMNMTTQRVRWIPLKAAAGGLSWSPDGRKVLVTTYATNPDSQGGSFGQRARTGFIVVDAKSGEAHFHRLTSDPNEPNTRRDLGWSKDGTLIWAPTGRETPSKVFYDLNGEPRPTPAHEADLAEQAGLSPNGRLLAVPGPPPGPNTIVTNLGTGKQAGLQPVEQLSAWADDTHLIALACSPNKCGGKGEFHNRYVLVSVDGKTLIPLTGYVQNSEVSGWEPTFTHR
ncbi:MAG: hypothetical protein ACRDP6_45315 [Actinoallomurus sp.]